MPHRHTFVLHALLAMLLGLLTGVLPARAQPGAGVAWPSAETVLADTQGTDPLDTAARQRAALLVLAKMVADSAGPERAFNLPQSLRPQRQAYLGAAQVIFNKVVAELDPPDAPKGRDSPRAKWYDLSSHYEFDPAFREALTQRYLSPKAAGELHGKQARELAQTAARVRQAQAREAAQLAQMRAQGARDEGLRQEAMARRAALWRAEMTTLAMVLGTYLAVFALLVTWRLMRRSAPPQDAADWSFQAGGNRVTFDVRTGTVADHRVRGDTYLSSSGGGNNQAITVSSHVVVKQAFRLLLGEGQADLPVQLSGLDLPLFDGQRVSIIRGFNAAGQQGHIVRLVNHSSKQVSVTHGSNVVPDWGLVWPWVVPSVVALPVAAVVPAGSGPLALVASGALFVLAIVVWAIDSRLAGSRLRKKLDTLAQAVAAAA